MEERESGARSTSLRCPRYGSTGPCSSAGIQPYVREHAFHLPPRNDAELHCPDYTRSMVLCRVSPIYDVAKQWNAAAYHYQQVDALGMVWT